MLDGNCQPRDCRVNMLEITHKVIRKVQVSHKSEPIRDNIEVELNIKVQSHFRIFKSPLN